MPFAALPVERRAGVQQDLSVFPRPNDRSLHQFVPVEAAVRAALDLRSPLDREQTAVGHVLALLHRQLALRVVGGAIPALECACLGPHAAGRRVRDLGARPLSRFAFQPVVAAVGEAVVPDGFLRVLDGCGLKAERVLKRTGQERGPLDEMAAEHHAIRTARDRQRPLRIGRRPVLVGFTEPRQPAVLVTEPDERLEGLRPASGRQEAAVGHAAPLAGEVIQVAGVLGSEGHVEQQLVDGHVVALRSHGQIDADHAVVFDRGLARDGQAVGGRAARQGNHRWRTRRELDRRAAERKRFSGGTAAQRDRRGQDGGLARHDLGRQERAVKVVGAAPRFYRRPLDHQRRPRRRNRVRDADAIAKPSVHEIRLQLRHGLWQGLGDQLGHRSGALPREMRPVGRGRTQVRAARVAQFCEQSHARRMQVDNRDVERLADLLHRSDVRLQRRVRLPVLERAAGDRGDEHRSRPQRPSVLDVLPQILLVVRVDVRRAIAFARLVVMAELDEHISGLRLQRLLPQPCADKALRTVARHGVIQHRDSVAEELVEHLPPPGQARPIRGRVRVRSHRRIANERDPHGGKFRRVFRRHAAAD